MEKGSGILLHISSLPSKHGIGTFGKEAHSFIKFLAKSKQKYWQICIHVFTSTRIPFFYHCQLHFYKTIYIRIVHLLY